MLNGKFVDKLLEDTSQKSTKKWTGDIHAGIVDLSWFGIWIGEFVGHFLENGLNETNGWVDATSGNTASFSDCAVKGKTNCHGIDWCVLSSIVLGDDQNKCHEHESANGLNGENSENIITIVVATINWAKLGNPEIITSNWYLLNVLLLVREGHDRDGTSKGGSSTLEENDEECEAQVSCEMSFALFPEHTDGHGRIKMSTTNWPKHLSHHHYSETNC